MMTSNKPVKRQKFANEGFAGRFRYFSGRALTNMRQNILVNVLTISTISLAILIISLFLLVFVNLESVAENWSRKVQVTIYFERELQPFEFSSLKGKILSLVGTERVIYVTKDEGLKRFRSRLKGQESLLEGVSADVLPASIEISLKRAYRSSDVINSYVTELKKIPGITEVQYGEEWVRRFSTFLTFMRLIGLLLGSFLVLAVIFIVSNTIKLTIFARKDELEILGLVGATRLFIKAPFLIEGILQGAVGSILAILILLLCYFGFLHNAGNFLSFNLAVTGISFLPPMHLVGIFLSGILLGFLGSLISLKRFICV